MKAIEQLERLQQINDLIKAEKTGSPEELSMKLGIGKRQLFKDLETLKDMGVDICYSKIRETYFYTNGHELEISYTFRVIPRWVSQGINGGFLSIKSQSAFFMHPANLF